MAKRKVIVVATPHTRAGTSAMMGALSLCGADIGGRHGKVNGPGFKNPKGHFELFSIEYGFFRKFYGPMYFSGLAPKLQQVIAIGQKHRKKLRKLIDLEFGNASTIALKGFGFLIVPILENFLDEFDVRVVSMVRGVKGRVESRARVQKHDSPGIPVDYHKLRSEIVSWDNLAMNIRKKCKVVPYHNVRFKNLINDPCRTINEVANFCDLSYPGNDVINNWIDKKLVNRSKI